MHTKALLRYIRIAPRKVRLVANLIKGKNVSEAQTILGFVNNSASKAFRKVIRSAVSSAAHDFQLDESNLYIADIVANEGPKLKRFRPRARGRAYPIQKKTSHITLVLDELVPGVIDKKGRPAQSPEDIQAGPPPAAASFNVGRGGERKFRYERKWRRPKFESIRNKIFRRKTV